MVTKYINKTNIEHSILALVSMLILGAFTGNWLMAAVAPMGFFLGREHAQFEYHLIKKKNISSVLLLNPLEGFNFKEWSLDSKMDFLCPAISNFVLYFIFAYFGISFSIF